MTRFVFLSDLHLSRPDPDDQLLHSDTRATLAAVIGRIAALDPAPDFAVLAGDLANHGTIDSYRLLRAMLAPLKMPVIPALGNHDDRAAFRAVFGWPDPADAPLFHHARRAGLHVIVLDSSCPGHVSGALDDGQFAALAAALDTEPELPKLLICHHPPHADRPGALPWESLGAADSARLAATIAGYKVAAMLCGHVHMNRVRHWHGVPVVIGMGLHNTVDPLEPEDMAIETGSGFALCTHDRDGFEVTFVPHDPPRRHLTRIASDVLRGFR